MRKGKLIVFEGVDGSGKSTQCVRLYEKLILEKKQNVFLTKEPGGTHIGDKIRAMLLNRAGFEISELTEFFLFMADRCQHISEVLQPHLEKEHILICDRFWYSTIVYQVFCSKNEVLQKYGYEMNSDIAEIVNPDIIIFLDTSVDVCMSRAKIKDRMEKKIDFNMVRKNYLKLWNMTSDNIIVETVKTDNRLIEDISEDIYERLTKYNIL